MSRYTPAARPLVQCLRTGGRRSEQATLVLRPATKSAATTTKAFSSTTHQLADTTTTSSSSTSTDAPLRTPLKWEDLEAWQQDPNLTTLPFAEKELMRRGTPPIGSRRRRMAIQTATAFERAIAGKTPGGPVPFELMPYQCFQEARKVLHADREEKLRDIATETAKIRKLEEVLAAAKDDPSKITSRGGVAYIKRRLGSLRRHLDELKVLADINDPLVKRRFEDGLGDMNKPVYRHLAEVRWRGRPLRLIEQRISQFHLVPDLLPKMKVGADVELFFRTYKVPHGAIVDSLISEVTPRLRIQVFDRGTRLVSVVVVDADVPDLEADSYKRRVHYIATNIPVEPTNPSVPLGRLDANSQVVLPWLPAFAQKGSAPHRLAVFVLEQPPVDPESYDKNSSSLDTAALQKAFGSDPASAIANSDGDVTGPRDNFSIRGFIDKNKLKVVGCTLFRTQWDTGTAGVMERAGVPGADVELKATRLPSLKPPRPARGWEAKHQGPKYRHLWKYTHRIATPRRKFVR